VENYWRPSVSYLSSLINNVISRINFYRNSISRFSDSCQKNEELEEVLWSDIDRWRERSEHRKKRTGRSCVSVSHSRDADSEEPTVVSRRLVPVFEESTVVQVHDHQTTPVRMYATGDTRHEKVRSKSYTEIEQIVYDVTVTSRYLSKAKSL